MFGGRTAASDKARAMGAYVKRLEARVDELQQSAAMHEGVAKHYHEALSHTVSEMDADHASSKAQLVAVEARAAEKEERIKWLLGKVDEHRKQTTELESALAASKHSNLELTLGASGRATAVIDAERHAAESSRLRSELKAQLAAHDAKLAAIVSTQGETVATVRRQSAAAHAETMKGVRAARAESERLYTASEDAAAASAAAAACAAAEKLAACESAARAKYARMQDEIARLRTQHDDAAAASASAHQDATEAESAAAAARVAAAEEVARSELEHAKVQSERARDAAESKAAAAHRSELQALKTLHAELLRDAVARGEEALSAAQHTATTERDSKDAALADAARESEERINAALRSQAAAAKAEMERTHADATAELARLDAKRAATREKKQATQHAALDLLRKDLLACQAELQKKLAAVEAKHAAALEKRDMVRATREAAHSQALASAQSRHDAGIEKIEASHTKQLESAANAHESALAARSAVVARHEDDARHREATHAKSMAAKEHSFRRTLEKLDAAHNAVLASEATRHEAALAGEASKLVATSAALESNATATRVAALAELGAAHAKSLALTERRMEQSAADAAKDHAKKLASVGQVAEGRLLEVDAIAKRHRVALREVEQNNALELAREREIGLEAVAAHNAASHALEAKHATSFAAKQAEFQNVLEKREESHAAATETLRSKHSEAMAFFQTSLTTELEDSAAQAQRDVAERIAAAEHRHSEILREAIDKEQAAHIATIAAERTKFAETLVTTRDTLAAQALEHERMRDKTLADQQREHDAQLAFIRNEMRDAMVASQLEVKRIDAESVAALSAAREEQQAAAQELAYAVESHEVALSAQHATHAELIAAHLASKSVATKETKAHYEAKEQQALATQRMELRDVFTQSQSEAESVARAAETRRVASIEQQCAAQEMAALTEDRKRHATRRTEREAQHAAALSSAAELAAATKDAAVANAVNIYQEAAQVATGGLSQAIEEQQRVHASALKSTLASHATKLAEVSVVHETELRRYAAALEEQSMRAASEIETLRETLSCSQSAAETELGEAAALLDTARSVHTSAMETALAGQSDAHESNFAARELAFRKSIEKTAAAHDAELVEALNSASTRSEAERTEDARGAEKRLSVALEAERRDHATKLSTARQESAAALRAARKTAASEMEIAVTNATQVYAEAARTTKGGLTSVIEGQRKAHAAALALRDETHAAALKSHLAAHDAHLARAAEAAASTEQRLISELAAYKEEHETVSSTIASANRSHAESMTESRTELQRLHAKQIDALAASHRDYLTDAAAQNEKAIAYAVSNAEAAVRTEFSDTLAVEKKRAVVEIAAMSSREEAGVAQLHDEYAERIALVRRRASGERNAAVASEREQLQFASGVAESFEKELADTKALLSSVQKERDAMEKQMEYTMQKYSKTKTALHSISTAATPPATPEKAGAASSFFGGLFGGSPTTTAAAGKTSSGGSFVQGLTEGFNMAIAESSEVREATAEATTRHRGGAPSASSAPAPAHAHALMSDDEITMMLRVVYLNFNPTKVSDVHELAQKYSTKGSDLLRGLRRKYGADDVESALRDANFPAQFLHQTKSVIDANPF